MTTLSSRRPIDHVLVTSSSSYSFPVNTRVPSFSLLCSPFQAVVSFPLGFSVQFSGTFVCPYIFLRLMYIHPTRLSPAKSSRRFVGSVVRRSQTFCCFVGRLVCRLVDRLVGRFFGWSVGLSVGLSVLNVLSVCRSVGRFFGRFVCRFVGSAVPNLFRFPRNLLIRLALRGGECDFHALPRR